VGVRRLAERPADTQLAAVDSGAKPDATQPTDITGLGLKVAPLNQDLRDKFQLNADQKGVVVTDVAPNTAAADRGLKPGDVNMEVQQGEVSSPAAIQKARTSSGEKGTSNSSSSRADSVPVFSLCTY